MLAVVLDVGEGSPYHPNMTANEINAFLEQAFTGPHRPVVDQVGVDQVGEETVSCRLRFHEAQIRPGGTLSGPTMMALADTAAYALVLACYGFMPLAVTTSLSVNFMRKPEPIDLIAHATMMKRGKALAVMDVRIFSEGDVRLVAQAIVTYSIPPRSK